MADAVSSSLESAVREAEDLEKSGSFTRAEVKYIFQKRARFEYLIKRRRTPAAHFLNYIKFETDLFKLHKLRKVCSTANVHSSCVLKFFVIFFLGSGTNFSCKGEQRLQRCWSQLHSQSPRFISARVTKVTRKRRSLAGL